MKNMKNQQYILTIVGNNIRHYRMTKGWSQEELAFECGLHRTYIGAVERGEKNITIVNLIKIKQKLGIRLEDLYPE